VFNQNQGYFSPVRHEKPFRNWNQFHQNIGQDIKQLLWYFPELSQVYTEKIPVVFSSIQFRFLKVQ